MLCMCRMPINKFINEMIILVHLEFFSLACMHMRPLYLAGPDHLGHLPSGLTLHKLRISTHVEYSLLSNNHYIYILYIFTHAVCCRSKHEMLN